MWNRPNVAGSDRSAGILSPAGSATAPSGTTVVNGVAISNYALSLGLSQPLVGNFWKPRDATYYGLTAKTNFDVDLFKNLSR